jgi:hypothetical protein
MALVLDIPTLSPEVEFYGIGAAQVANAKPFVLERLILILSDISTASLLAALICAPAVALAQAGPPFLTNDPGTPGNGNWEINVAAAQSISRVSAAYQVPQIDLNFGLGNRVQLTYEVPYVLQSAPGQPRQSGWSNAFPGLKWRFYDDGEGGWQLSLFPQMEANAPPSSLQKGLAAPGSRFLLPVQVTKRLGPVDVDFEAGYYFPKRGVSEDIFGLVVGRSITDKFDLGVEIYRDQAVPGPPNETTLDIGGRYKLARGFIALFMAGRSISGTANGQPEFIGYFGIQVLLSDYGRSLTKEP